MRIANTKIRTYTQRRKLAPRTAPYFNTIAPCRLLGYVKREGEAVPGRWVVQVETGKTESDSPIRRRHPLGVADDLALANGVDVLSFEQAYERANEWQPDGSPPGSKKGEAFTVRDAVKQHRNYSGKNGDKAERNKLSAYQSLVWNVLREYQDGTPREGAKGLGDVAVDHLTKDMLVDWLNGLIRHDIKETPQATERAHIASRANAARIWSTFRSCLERAYERKKNGIRATPWRDVKSLGKKGNRREVHFSGEQARTIIAAVRANGHAAEADLFQAYAYTGARPGGELASLTVADFDAATGTLHVRARSEQRINKQGKERYITLLEDEAVAFFKRMAGDRAKSAPLLSPDGVERWDTKQRQRLFATILREAGAPEGSVCYSFRHGYISQLANQGVGLHMIAENCGTSVGQIEANYAKFRADEFRAVVAATTDKRPTLRLVKTEEPRQDEHQDLLPAAA